MPPKINCQDLSEQKNEKPVHMEIFALMEAVGQGVVYHSSDGKIISANPTAVRILGGKIQNLAELDLTETPKRLILADGSLLQIDQSPVSVALRTGKTVSNAFVCSHLLPLSIQAKVQLNGTCQDHAFAHNIIVSKMPREIPCRLEIVSGND